jgi:hypothetical protein
MSLVRANTFQDGSHRDNFCESLETLSAVESQSWVSCYFLGYGCRFLTPKGLAYGLVITLSIPSCGF